MKASASAVPSSDKQFSVYVASRVNRIIMAVGVAIIVVLAIFPLIGGTAMTRRLVLFFAYLALAQFWNLMLGYAGLISVGQQGYIGVGAYACWLFADVLHVNPFVGVLFAVVCGAVIALPSAALVFKLRGGYLAIGTWVIAEVLRLIVANIKAAGGGSGITIQAAGALGNETRVSGTYWWALAAALAYRLGSQGYPRQRSGRGEFWR
jgi:branched-chain amino acid transport system permease protein